jgi:hypothetical protein
MGGVASRRKDDGGLCGEPGHLLGPGPPQGTPLACHGHPGVLGRCPLGPQLSGAFAAAYWRLPAAILCGVGACLQAQWHVTTDGRGRAGRPGPVDACAAGRGVPRLGHRARPTPLTTGVCGGDLSHVTQARSGGVNARQLTPCRDDGDGHGALPPLTACRAATTGGRRQGCTGAWRACARRGRRSVCACPART